MRQFKISQEVLEKVLNYMASKPYLEVFQLITALQALEPVEGTAPAALMPNAKADKKSGKNEPETAQLEY